MSITQHIYFMFNVLVALFVIGGPLFLLFLFVYFLESYKDFFAYWMAVILSLLAHFVIAFCFMYYDLSLIDVEGRDFDDVISSLLPITIVWFLIAVGAAALNFLYDRRHKIAKALINFNQSMKK